MSPKKEQERRFLDTAIADLGWDARVIAENEGPPAEPPDFDVERSGERIAVEVRRVFRGEGERGSTQREREDVWRRFLRDLAKRYYADSASRPISLLATLPSPVDSPSVRPTSMPELNAQANAIADAALRELHARTLAPIEVHRFEIRVPPDTRPAVFCVQGLPETPEFRRYCRWQVTNQTAGWVGSFDGPDLEPAIIDKAADRLRYASRYSKTVLLLVADGARASGYNNLGRGPVVSHGFDEIYFLPYLRGRTERVARREDPVEQKEACEIVDLAAQAFGHAATCASRILIDAECDCEVMQAAEVRAALSELLGIAWRVTAVEGEPSGPPGTFISREDAARLRAAAKRAKEAIGDVLLLASEIGHGNMSTEGQELHSAVESVRTVATRRRPGSS